MSQSDPRHRIHAYRDVVYAYRDLVHAYRDVVSAYRDIVYAYRDIVHAYRDFASSAPGSLLLHSEVWGLRPSEVPPARGEDAASRLGIDGCEVASRAKFYSGSRIYVLTEG